MSRLRTSSPWTTPTTTTGARILREEPATIDAIPTMTLAQMEAALAGTTEPAVPAAGAVRDRWTALRRVAAVAAVVVTLAGCAGGMAMGAGRPSRVGPASASATPVAAAPTAVAATPVSVSAIDDPGLAVAMGGTVAGGALLGATPDGPADAELLPAAGERSGREQAGRGRAWWSAALGAAMGEVAAATAPSTATFAASYP